MCNKAYSKAGVLFPIPTWPHLDKNESGRRLMRAMYVAYAT
jgi:hypothetical protein